MFLGYSDPLKTIFTIHMVNIRGDETNTSAKTRSHANDGQRTGTCSPLQCQCHHCRWWIWKRSPWGHRCIHCHAWCRNLQALALIGPPGHLQSHQTLTHIVWPLNIQTLCKSFTDIQIRQMMSYSPSEGAFEAPACWASCAMRPVTMVTCMLESVLKTKFVWILTGRTVHERAYGHIPWFKTWFELQSSHSKPCWKSSVWFCVFDPVKMDEEHITSGKTSQ